MKRFVVSLLFVFVCASELIAASLSLATSVRHFRQDTFMVYEQRLQRVESTWSDLRAITTKESDGHYAAVLFDSAGRKVAERWLAAPDPLVEVVNTPESIGKAREQEDKSVARANDLLARDYRMNRRSAQPDAMPNQVKMDFGSFTTTSFSDPVMPAKLREPNTAYSTFHTVLRDSATGQDIGILRWFEREQVLVWRIDNLGKYGEGVVTPKRLERIGGWPFAPDMAWAGIQTLAFRDSAVRSQARDRERTSSLGLVSALSLSPKANDCDGLPDGCTWLHFLDGSVFQDCCDQHDICYEYDPPDGCCTAWSWIFPTDWHCVMCNIEVVYCFLTLNAGGGGGGGGDGGDPCTIYIWAWCPPECFSCRRELY